MTKQEYMDALKDALRNYPEDTRYEILSDFEEHFVEGEMDGRSEEDVVNELGSIDDVVSYLKQSYKPEEKKDVFSILDKVLKYVDTDLSNIEIHINDDKEKPLEWHTAEAKSNLFITATKGSITLKITKGDTFRFALSNTKTQLEIVPSNDVIKVEAKGNNFSRTTLYIEIPDIVKTIRIQNSLGDVYLTDIHVLDFRSELSSGDINIYKSSSQTFDITTLHGDIKLDEVIGEVIGKSSAGDISLKSVEGNVTVETLAGDVKLDSSLGDNLHATSKAGDVHGNADYKHIYAKTYAGDVKYRCNNEIEDAECVSMAGDVKFYIVESQQDIGCVLKCMLGDTRNKSHLTQQTNGKILLKSHLGDVKLKER